jgi:hypothetical protein
MTMDMAYPPVVHEFFWVLSVVRVAQSLVICVVFVDYLFLAASVV